MSRLAYAAFAVVALATPADAASFLFIRHAESTTNAGAAGPADLVDPPLTDLGRQQAEALAVALADVDLTTIYVSSYQRTALTIAPTAAAFGLTPVVVPEIREWSFGTGPLDFPAIQAMFGQWLTGNTAARIEGVPDSESLDELSARVVPAYEAIVARHADEDGGVAIVAHGGSIAWPMPEFARNVTLDFTVANGLRNTGVVQVELFGGAPYVTNWQGTEIDWPGTVAPVPLPAAGLLLLGGLGLLGGAAARARRAA